MTFECKDPGGVMDNLSRIKTSSLCRVAIVTSIHPDFDSRIWKHANLLSDSGIQVDLICPWDVSAGEVHNNIHFHPFRKATSRLKRLYQVPAGVLPLLYQVMRKVEIIHFHDIDLLPLMVFVSFFKKVVYDVHENYAEEMRVRTWIPKMLRLPLSFVVHWGQFFCSLIVRNVVLVAPSQEKDFSHNRIHRIYLYNYASNKLLDTVRDDYLDRGDCVVFIGSQHVNNGSFLLLDIAELVVQANPAIRFLVTDRFFGDDFRKQVVSQIRVRRLNDHVTLIPNVKPHELMQVLNNATIGISPNLRVAQQINGIHTKLFEYMAAGIPMVVSDLPHQAGVLKESNCGCLAQPEDPGSFAQAILSLAKDRVRSRELGRNGQNSFVKNYCYESQVEKLLGYYKEVMDE